MDTKKIILLSTILGFTAVILGALGAHALKSVLSEQALESYLTGVRYQMYHALAIIVVALVEVKRSKLIMWFFLFGIILFSGGLFAYSLSYLFYDYGYEFFGIFAPFGGLFFILAWLLLALGFISKKA